MGDQSDTPTNAYLSFEFVRCCQDHYTFWQTVPVLYYSSAERLTSNIQSAVFFLDLETVPSRGSASTCRLGEEMILWNVN